MLFLILAKTYGTILVIVIILIKAAIAWTPVIRLIMVILIVVRQIGKLKVWDVVDNKNYNVMPGYGEGTFMHSERLSNV